MNSDDKFEFVGTCAGFTNTTFNRMFVEHSLNTHHIGIQMPAIFEITDPSLIAKAKKLPARQVLKFTVSRKTEGTVLAAIIHDFKKIKKPTKK